MLIKVTRRLIIQKARRHPVNRTPTACKQMVSDSISLPCSGFFSPFLHSTGSLSVSQEYLALPDGAGRFIQDFTGPVLLRILLGIKFVLCTGLSPSLESLSRNFHYKFNFHIAVLQPQPCRNKFGLGSSPFARHYLGNHYCFLFHQVLRCFSSLGLLLIFRYPDYSGWVSPFGDLRIIGYRHLPEA